jgi:hypothetical protein
VNCGYGLLTIDILGHSCHFHFTPLFRLLKPSFTPIPREGGNHLAGNVVEQASPAQHFDVAGNEGLEAVSDGDEV